MANAGPAAKKPLLRVKSHFSPLLILYRHPIRLTVSMAIPFMLLPDLTKLVEGEWRMPQHDARIAVVAGILGLVFLPQLLASALNCSKVVFEFYRDHVEFTESFLLRDVIKLPYSSVVGVNVSSSVIQKMAGVSDIKLSLHGRMGRLQNPKQLKQVIHDVKKAPAYAREIDRIMKAWQATQPPSEAPVKDSGGNPPPR